MFPAALNDEFNTFVKELYKNRSNNHYVSFWANFAKSNGLSIKTNDGRELIINPKDIYCIDLGEMAGNCLCGHAIRYEFWLGEYGPIGSKCIQTMTGLEGQNLKTLLKGAEIAKSEAEELKEVRQKYITLDKQIEENPYIAEMIKWVADNNPKLPELIQKFIDNDMPLTSKIINELNIIYRTEKRKEGMFAKYGKEFNDNMNCHHEYYVQVKKMIEGIKSERFSNIVFEKNLSEKYIYRSINSIANQAMTGRNLSDKQVWLFNKCVNSVKDPKYVEALDVLTKLVDVDTGDFWNKIVLETLERHVTYGSSPAQLEFIVGKTSTGKDGLSTRFAKKLEEIRADVFEEKQVVAKDNPSPYTANVVAKTSEKLNVKENKNVKQTSNLEQYQLFDCGDKPEDKGTFGSNDKNSQFDNSAEAIDRSVNYEEELNKPDFDLVKKPAKTDEQGNPW